jgi:hypothetical protein
VIRTIAPAFAGNIIGGTLMRQRRTHFCAMDHVELLGATNLPEFLTVFDLPKAFRDASSSARPGLLTDRAGLGSWNGTR